MAEPIMDQYEKINSYDVHKYQVRCVFGAGTAMTYRSRDAIPTRPTATTLVVTLPKSYAELVGFKVGRQATVGAATLDWIITTDNSAIDGTVTLTSVNSAGAATTPASGDRSFFELSLSSDTLNDRFVGP